MILKTLIFFLFFTQGLFANKLPEISAADVVTTLNQIMEAHASHKALSPPLIKRALESYVEQLDPTKTYFLKEDVVLRESLHFHELIHVIQWQHLGGNPFLLHYADGLLRFGYADSPMERMAYTLQNQFEEGCEPFNIEDLVRSKLDELVNSGPDNRQ